MRYKVKGVKNLEWEWVEDHKMPSLAYYSGYYPDGRLGFKNLLWQKSMLSPIEPPIIKEPEEWL